MFFVFIICIKQPQCLREMCYVAVVESSNCKGWGAGITILKVVVCAISYELQMEEFKHDIIFAKLILARLVPMYTPVAALRDFTHYL